MISGASSSVSASSGTDRSDYLTQMFDQLDSDGDGTVTEDEFAAILDKQRGGASASSEETASTDTSSKTSELFAKTDTDGDGTLSADEFATAMAQMQAGGPPPPPPPPSDSTSEEDSDSVSSLFASVDTDGDGVVSLAELQASLTKSTDDSSDTETTDATTSTDSTTSSQFSSLLTALDTDGDGSLSEDEFSEAFRQVPPPPPPDFGGAYGESLSGSDDQGLSFEGVA
jgi:Ca2+-binding EF-hand superfamily protein